LLRCTSSTRVYLIQFWMKIEYVFIEYVFVSRSSKKALLQVLIWKLQTSRLEMWAVQQILIPRNWAPLSLPLPCLVNHFVHARLRVQSSCSLADRRDPRNALYHQVAPFAKSVLRKQFPASLPETFSQVRNIPNYQAICLHWNSGTPSAFHSHQTHHNSFHADGSWPLDKPQRHALRHGIQGAPAAARLGVGGGVAARHVRQRGLRGLGICRQLLPAAQMAPPKPQAQVQALLRLCPKEAVGPREKAGVGGRFSGEDAVGGSQGGGDAPPAVGGGRPEQGHVSAGEGDTWRP
jgi:hypothetical protein